MEIWPFPGRSVGRAPRPLRAVVYALVLAGGGLAATLGINLAILALEARPGGRDAARQSAGGALVICGGGKLPDTVRDRFFDLAGGRRAQIVVIPTANRSAALGGDFTRQLHPWRTRGASGVQVLHTRSRDVANDPEFVRPLREATGVWFEGGDQLWLTRTYLGTEVERGLRDVLERGGVIGGTSAGAAVMTRVMIARGRTKPDLGEGFGFLPDALVDQHFLKRNRLGRLLTALSDHPELVGLGIDESTALVVHVRSRLLSVIGDSYVVACVPDPKGTNPARVEILKPGDETNLSALREPGTTIASAINLEAL